MATIYKISLPLDGATLTAGTVQVSDGSLAVSDGTIIRGVIDDGTNPVANVPVVLVETVSSIQTIIGEALTDADGFYMFGIATVNASATYTIKTTDYTV